MNEIRIVDITSQGPACCRELCNALMQHQAARAQRYSSILAAMTYETRLAPSFERNPDKLLLAAMDGKRPVGYLFAVAETITEGAKAFRPPWAAAMEPADRQGLGFYPPDLDTPCCIGEINNLYVLPAYRGAHLGDRLMEQGLAWIRSHKEAKKAFVMVSNGNDAGPFYEKYGFAFSHEVLGGIIQAYSMDL